jgi:hypothetical protein
VATAAPEASTNLAVVHAGVGPSQDPPLDGAETVVAMSSFPGGGVEFGKGTDARDPGSTPSEPAGDLDLGTTGVRQPFDSALEGPSTERSWPNGAFRKISF